MKGDDLSERLLRFAAHVVRVCRTFPNDVVSKHIVRQLVRAATGGGANYEEARGAESRADFVHKMAVANKEVREALYWLALALEAELVDKARLASVLREADELVAILTASINTARRRQPDETRDSAANRPP